MSLKTPNLFDVPKDRPTAMERLEAFKRRNEIFTYGGRTTGWDAMLVLQTRELLRDYGNPWTVHPIKLIADYCRLIEEANLLVTANTERQAIEELCRLNNIPFNL